ncbi:MAG: hypothetical protein NT062_21530 [Proteobacteria bacterium]|nr:hypothetical protein [Pseudomonadota bacterium]
MTEPCAHVTRVDGQCTTCGDCLHEVVLNAACFYCGTTDLDPIAMSPKLSPKPPALIAKATLVRRK